MAWVIGSTDTEYHNSVRRLLGGVDDLALPNEDIEDPTVFDMARLRVLEMVPEAETLAWTADPTPALTADGQKIRLAALYVMASLLCPTMATRVEYEVKTIDVTWKKKAIDYDELKETLMGKAIGLLDGVDTSAVGDSQIFAVAPSKRVVNNEY